MKTATIPTVTEEQWRGLYYDDLEYLTKTYSIHHGEATKLVLDRLKGFTEDADDLGLWEKRHLALALVLWNLHDKS